MNLAAKVALVFALAATLAGAILGGYVAKQGFERERERILADAQLQLFQSPELLFRIYSADKKALSISLAPFIVADSVTSAAIFDSGAKNIVERFSVSFEFASKESRPSLPNLKIVRAGASVADTVLSNGMSVVPGDFWFFLNDSKKPLYFSMPVLTDIDPTKAGLSARDFSRVPASPGIGRSNVVMGYVVLGIDQTAMLQAAMPAILTVSLVYFSLVLLGAILIYALIRNGMRPLRQLTELASQMRSGGQRDELKIEGSSEFRDILIAIHEMITRVRKQSQDMLADRKRLQMKVSESASQLSIREQELKQAGEQINVAESRLHKLSYYDGLTALPNRTLFTEQLRRQLRLRERDERPLALLLINLKNFKRVNEALGHSAGDLLLVQVGKRLVACIQAMDILTKNEAGAVGIEVSRVDGDEFSIVLVERDDVDSASAVSAELLEAFKAPFTVDKQEVIVTPAVGIARAPDDGDSVEALLSAAAQAMRQEEQGGPSEKGDNQGAAAGARANRFQMEAELRKAIERDQLLLHYQPQVDTVTGGILGAEALLRWEHPELGLVPPYQFIPLAEEAGMIEEFGYWVLEEACRQLQAWHREGLELPKVAINVSSLDFSHGFAHEIRDVLHQRRLSPEMLELGLSESILMASRGDTAQSLRELSDLGVYLSVDNFGTTPATLGYLSHHPLDEIKIDRSFVVDCDQSAPNAEMVKAVASMAASLGLAVTAEGVETAGELRFLAAIELRAMQGYLFSKPVEPSELEEQLRVPWYFMQHIQNLKQT